jgi:hypothetical protein
VKLDGVKYGLAGEFTQKIIGEPVKRSFVAYYIDSGASAEQREALRKLFTGPSFAGMGQSAELKEVPIKFENLDAFKSGRQSAAQRAISPRWRLHRLPAARTRTNRSRLTTRLSQA